MTPSDTPETVDPASLSLGQVLRQYPLGKLATAVVTLLGVGFGAGYQLRGMLLEKELQGCKDQYALLDKHANTLQQAINAGTCVKSEALAQREEARRFLGKLDVTQRGIAVMYEGVMKGHGFDGVVMDSNYAGSIDLGKFLEDPRVGELVNALNFDTFRLNDALSGLGHSLDFLKSCREQNKGKEAPAPDCSQLEKQVANAQNDITRFTAQLNEAREYMRARYLSLGPPP